MTVSMYNINTNDRIVLKTAGYNIKHIKKGEVIKEVTNTLVNEMSELSKQGYYAE